MTANALDAAAAKVRRRLVPFLFLLYIVAYLDRINIGFASLQMNEALGFSAAVYGFGAGIFFLSYTAFEIPSNIILARVGARRWIARIMITWGLASAAMMFAHDATSFYILRFVLGAAEAGFFPGIIYYLTRWVPARERARTVASFMTAVVTAGIVGGPLSGALLSMDGLGGLAGWQWMFLLEGIPATVLGFVVLRVLDETPADARWLTDPEKSALISRLQQESAPAAGRADGVSDALRHPWIWVLALVYFVVPVALYGFGFFLPQILRSTFAGTPFQIGALSAIPYLAGAAGMIVTSRHSDRTGERRWHVAVAAALAGVAFMATAFVEGLAPSLVLLSIAMLGLASMFGPFWTLATSFVQGPGAAAGIALINSVGNVGGFVGPYGIGYLRDTTSGYSAGLMGIGAVVLAGGALVLLVPDRSRRSG
ncbi:MAG TPA: MFS transporter [Vicinamibacterales bacterium]|nr:MFS transporter [Vicinamibacterales bacterium]